MSKQKYNAHTKNKLMLNNFLLGLVTSIPAIIGLGLIVVGKGPLDRWRVSLGCFVIGFTGIIVIIRKEIPISIGSIQGKWAVIQGWLFTILLWGISLYVLLFGV